MSNSTYDQYAELVQKSLATLDRTMFASVGLLTSGTLAFVTNILVVLMIVKYDKLRTVSHFLISQLAIADWLVGASYMATGIKRLIRIYFRIPEVNNQVACCAEMSLAYFSQAASLTLALAISVERVVATLSPIHYRKINRPLVVSLSMIGWMYAAVDTGFMFYGISSEKLIPNCNLVSSVKIARMLGVVSLMYLVTQIVTRIGLAILGRLPAAVRANYAPFIRMLMIVNSGINFFIYVKLSSEYKNGFSVLLGKPVAEPSTRWVPTPAPDGSKAYSRLRRSLASRSNVVVPKNNPSRVGSSTPAGAMD